MNLTKTANTQADCDLPERLRRIPDRNEPPRLCFLSLGVLVVPLSDLNKTFEAYKE